jgi:hypothetical protein
VPHDEHADPGAQESANMETTTAHTPSPEVRIPRDIWEDINCMLRDLRDSSADVDRNDAAFFHHIQLSAAIILRRARGLN